MNRSERLAFLKESIYNLRDTGSITPSSVFLADSLTAPIRFKPGMTVVELGAGTGSVTKHLLKILPVDATLISLEINPVLMKRLALTIKDERCRLMQADAQDLSQILKELAIPKVDYVISGIPLANLANNVRHNIYIEIGKVLHKDGLYTQFQYFMTNYAEIKKYFQMTNLAFEWRNIPPAFVYTSKLL